MKKNMIINGIIFLSMVLMSTTLQAQTETFPIRIGLSNKNNNVIIPAEKKKECECQKKDCKCKCEHQTCLVADINTIVDFSAVIIPDEGISVTPFVQFEGMSEPCLGNPVTATFENPISEIFQTFKCCKGCETNFTVGVRFTNITLEQLTQITSQQYNTLGCECGGDRFVLPDIEFTPLTVRLNSDNTIDVSDCITVLCCDGCGEVCDCCGFQCP